MMAPLLAPIVRRMPISRPLSFTSMMRPEMMFNAATRTITDRMMNIMLRSTSSTVKKLSLRCPPVGEMERRDACLLQVAIVVRPSPGRSTMISSTSTGVALAEVALRFRSGMKIMVRSYSDMPISKSAATL